MKIISKYQFREADDISQLLNASKLLVRSMQKTAFFILAGASVINAAYGQRGIAHRMGDSSLYIFAGASKLFVQRRAFDQWTQSNFNLTESYRPSIYVDLGSLFYKYDLGITINIGGTFQTNVAYVGRRLTGDNSLVGSWLNVELGDVFARLTNITPPTYAAPPSGQQMELHYDAFYVALTSKNYLNFFHYTAKLGKARIPVNSGFFATIGWQPGMRNWRYGYYDQDSVFRTQRIKPIPKLGKVQGTAGVFMGF